MDSPVRFLLLCASLLLADRAVAAAGATISYVQGASTSAGDQQSVVVATFPSLQAAGDLNVVFIAWADGDARVISVTDTSGNLYLRAHAISTVGLGTQVAYYAADISHAAPQANSVRVMFSSDVKMPTLGIAEYHGVARERTLERAAGGAVDSSVVPGEILATSSAGDLLVAGASTTGRLLGSGPDYTQRLLTDQSSFLIEDRSISAAGRYGATAAQNPAGHYLIQLLALRAAPSAPVPPPPYPPSQLTTGMNWDFSTVLSHRKGIGSDIWPTTWGADGDLYAAWGDGGGFDGTESSEATGRVSLGFARISGSPDTADAGTLHGKNVWGRAPRFAAAQATFGGKVVDIISINGVLYAQGGLWTTTNCHCADPTAKSEANAVARSFAWSYDLGKTWQHADWSLPSDLGSTLQFGQDYAGAFDPAHVYFYYQRDVKADFTHLYLRRLRTEELARNPAAPPRFEYLTAVDAAGTPHWSTTEPDAVPVFTDPNAAPGTFASPSVVYDAPLRRYLLAAFHGAATGQLGLFEGSAPWGPWATLGYYEDWGSFNETAGESTGFGIPSKWISSDGRTLWVIFSGVNNGADNEFDSFNVVRATLQ
jgi:hypothetical protein